LLPRKQPRSDDELPPAPALSTSTTRTRAPSWKELLLWSAAYCFESEERREKKKKIEGEKSGAKARRESVVEIFPSLNFFRRTTSLALSFVVEVFFLFLFFLSLSLLMASTSFSLAPRALAQPHGGRSSSSSGARRGVRCVIRFLFGGFRISLSLSLLRPVADAL